MTNVIESVTRASDTLCTERLVVVLAGLDRDDLSLPERVSRIAVIDVLEARHPEVRRAIDQHVVRPGGSYVEAIIEAAIDATS